MGAISSNRSLRATRSVAGMPYPSSPKDNHPDYAQLQPVRSAPGTGQSLGLPPPTMSDYQYTGQLPISSNASSPVKNPSYHHALPPPAAYSGQRQRDYVGGLPKARSVELGRLLQNPNRPSPSPARSNEQRYDDVMFVQHME